MPKVSRRSFLKGASVALGTAPLLGADGGSAPAGLRVVEDGERVAVSLDVNGQRHALEVHSGTPLAEALREGAGLTGTKLCCEGGACGACTVLLDGRPVTSCLVLALDADGAEVRTVEGVGAKALHPVQQAFIDADALQCGFCTPGFVMSAVAFFERWKREHGDARPPREDVQRALSGNLCRCGAQPALVAAVQAACEGRRAEPLRARGDDVPALVRLDAREKVTGQATYAFDYQPKGMLHTYIVRATSGHGRVKRIDTSAAGGMPGVRATRVLLPKGPQGYVTLRFVGQEIVAVCADSYRQAAAAAARVVIDVEELPCAVDPVFAERDDAPLVFPAPRDEKVPGVTEAPKPPEALFQWRGNVRGPMVWPLDGSDDEVDAALANTPVRVALHAETAAQCHVSLERHVCVAEWQGDELVMHASSQATQMLAHDLASALDVPTSKVRVVSPYVGGGFGAKAQLRPEHLAAARLAKETGRPVRVALRLDEHITVGGNRPGTLQDLELGAEPDGRLVAVRHEGRTLCGAAVGERTTGLTDVHYPFAVKRLVDRNVVTHTPPGCPFRAPGFPPNAFTLEQAVDEVAVRVDKDPLTLRLEQEAHRRKRMVYRLAKERAGYGERLREVARDLSKERGRYALGLGVATAEWFVLSSPSCRVELRAFRDGDVEVSTATHDLGQGARTVLASVVHDVLGVPAERIRVRVGDSALTPAPGTFGSISTSSIAGAAFKACEELKATLVPRALERYPGAQATSAGIVLEEEGVARTLSFADLFELLPEEPYVVLSARGADRGGFKLPPVRLGDALASQLPFAMSHDIASSAQIAEVEVDRWLGRVRVRKVVVAIDAGRIVSRTTARSQCIGAVLQGISYALYEERRLDARDGRQLSRSFESYGLLGVADAPDVDVCFLDVPSESTPYGCFGLGESSTVATSAAVANAVFRAVGRRVTSSPMTPARVLAAMARGA